MEEENENKNDEGYDWSGLAWDLAGFALKGAMMTLGSVAVNETYRGIRSYGDESDAGNVLTIRQASNK